MRTGARAVIIGIPTETVANERRVSLVPTVAEQIIDLGHDILVASGAGEPADFGDSAYESAGCEVVSERADVFERADVVLQVNGAAAGESLDPYSEGQIVIGQLGPYDVSDDTLAELAERDVSAFALELIPRISRAQSMDALSSMASLGGYQATLMGAAELPKMLPMEMTAAGTIRPADVFVIGAGVAGLKAIATSERLGGYTRGYDIRLEVKREVESLGADFVELDLETEDSGDQEGYAREMDDEFYRQQRKELTRVVADSDIVITTAAIPGQPAPELVTTEMIENMDSGSVIIDLSAGTGGNCEPTEADEVVHHEGVTIHGPTNLTSEVSHTASQQLSNNLFNFLENLLEDGNIVFDFEDEIIDSTLLTHNGTVRAPHRDDGGEPDTGDEPDEQTDTDDPAATAGAGEAPDAE